MQKHIDITWIEPYYDLVLNMIPKNAKSILDIGAGSGIFGYILRKTRQAQLTAIEPFSYDLTHYDRVINSTWQDAIPQSNDIVIALEVIEHMDKSDALDFLTYCKDICNSMVIISTPFVFEQQPEYDNNPYQKHRCNITIDDFLKHKYKVYLIGNFPLFNRYGLQMRLMANRYYKFILQKLGFNITNIIGVYEK